MVTLLFLLFGLLFVFLLFWTIWKAVSTATYKGQPISDRYKSMDPNSRIWTRAKAKAYIEQQWYANMRSYGISEEYIAQAFEIRKLQKKRDEAKKLLAGW